MKELIIIFTFFHANFTCFADLFCSRRNSLSQRLSMTPVRRFLILILAFQAAYPIRPKTITHGIVAGLKNKKGACRAGFYCIADDSFERYCGGNNWWCTANSTQPTRVTSGYYSFGGTELSRLSQKECEIGFYCVGGERNPCPPGTVGNTTGLFTKICSGPCPEGFYCPNDGTLDGTHCGDASVYCPEGSIAPRIVSSGFYSVHGTLDKRTQQNIAPPGSYAINGTLLDCPPGRYGASTGESNAWCSGECHEGFFCPAASTSPRQLYCGGEDKFCLAGSSVPSLVRDGYYTSTATETCSPGCWRNASLSIDQSLHPAVLHSAIPTSVETPPCVICGEGTFKYQKGDSHDLCLQCPPLSSVSTKDRITCDCFRLETGDPFNALFFNATSRKCESLDVAGKQRTSFHYEHILPKTQLTKTEQFLCESGFFCQKGTRFPCPKGFFGLKSGETRLLCDGECPSGFYCNGATTEAISCGRTDLFCPRGSFSPRSVSKGFETLNNNNSNFFPTLATPLSSIRDAERQCPLGRFCVGGVRHRCPGGMFGNKKGLSDPSCSGKCLPGYFCPPGSTSSMQQQCGNVTVYCPLASDRPLLAKDGYYTFQRRADNGLQQTAHLQIKCEKGYFCRFGVQNQCPSGTYGWIEGASFEVDACKICKEGYYCPSSRGAPSVDESSQRPCGSSQVYCPKLSGNPLTVDVGYYSVGGDTESFRSSQEICLKGHYCIDGISYKCAAGRYGSSTGLITGMCSGFCPAGFKCPEEGTMVPIECPEHSFASLGSTACTQCFADGLLAKGFNRERCKTEENAARS